MDDWSDYHDWIEDAPLSIFVSPDDDELIERSDNEVVEECDDEGYGAWLAQGERIIPNRPT